MIEHMVFFATKEHTSATTRQQMIAKLAGLKEQISEIIEISAGENFSDRGQGFDLGLLVRLAGREELARYAQHPAHIQVVNEWIKPNVEKVIACDFEVPST